ncbi:MAG: DKNYY domain-containing protein [Leptospirales bacterium]
MLNFSKYTVICLTLFISICHKPDTIPIIEGKTFLGYNYYKDDAFIYAADEHGLNHMKKSDYDSFIVLYSGYSKDENGVYFLGYDLPGAHAESFYVLNRTLFARDKKAIYRGRKSFDGPDLESFIALNDDYAKDKNRVYYYYEWENDFKLADLQTFQVAENSNEYAFDKRNVYYHGLQIDDADPDSFSLFTQSTNFARDNTSVFYRGRKIYYANTADFQILDAQSDYAKDSLRVFYGADVISGAHPNSFSVVKYNYGKDKHYIYCSGKKTDYNIMSFYPFNFFYAKDSDGVYYLYTDCAHPKNEMKIDKADPETFEIILIDVDFSFAKDKKHVYVNNDLITGADPKSFSSDNFDYNYYIDTGNARLMPEQK